MDDGVTVLLYNEHYQTPRTNGMVLQLDIYQSSFSDTYVYTFVAKKSTAELTCQLISFNHRVLCIQWGPLGSCAGLG